jgi:predicted DCC family thiol-disulfide oxidoreductase YuxK
VNEVTLTIFYDGRCPLCSAEIKQLSEFDAAGRLILEDINAQGFQQRYPHIDPKAADRILHGQYGSGELIYGLDVTQQAWALVGRHRWLKLLRLPLIRWFADLGYLLFARYRSQISYLLTGSSQCDENACYQIPSRSKRS